MSNYTRLPIDTVEGALAYADSYIAGDEEWGYEEVDVSQAFETFVAEIRRLRPDLR